MRIALCLSGYFCGKSGPKAADDGYEYIKKKILDNHHVDVFVHSWDVEHKDRIAVLYQPKRAVYQEQYSFEKELKNFDEQWFKKDLPHSSLYRSPFSSLSMNYSRKCSLKQKKKYEEQHHFVYDCVVMARFDLGQRGKEHPQPYYVCNINFKPELDMNYFYSAFWHQLNCGFAEHWMYSSSENMDKLSLLYDRILDYYSPDNDYLKAMTTGWPYSNKYSEFSNEIMLKKEQRTTELRKYPNWECINNHSVYKWFFLEQNLMSKCRFLDITKE
jgi:hypothetical protein